MKVYLDNAATTQLDTEVIDEMSKVMHTCYGNPSSLHSFGRSAKAVIEQCRKSVAKHINATPSEIYFTAGGTEADNMVLQRAFHDLDVQHIVSTKIEHHAVLDTIECVNNTQKDCDVTWLNVNEDGEIDLNELEEVLALNATKRTLVSLMHGNNEIATMLPIEKVAQICKKYGAFFHSDTVQTMCHYRFDVEKLGIDFLTCSAHKFHGPKGSGFLYINKSIQIKPHIIGGSQERNVRAGTENVVGIAGLSKAMDIAYEHLEDHHIYVSGLKQYMKNSLKENFPEIQFNGNHMESGLYTVLNVCFPKSDIDEMFIYSLDIEGIAASGGSACSSGSKKGSHVLAALGKDPMRAHIRFSFSKFNTKEEIDLVVSKVQSMLGVSV